MKWKAYAIRVIKNDCMACGFNIDEHKNTCAIAALAMAAGVKPPRVNGNESNSGITGGGPWTRRAFRAIQKRFGLDMKQQEALQDANDSVGNRGTPGTKAFWDAVQQRREAVLDVLKTF